MFNQEPWHVYSVLSRLINEERSAVGGSRLGETRVSIFLGALHPQTRAFNVYFRWNARDLGVVSSVGGGVLKKVTPPSNASCSRGNVFRRACFQVYPLFIRIKCEHLYKFSIDTGELEPFLLTFWPLFVLFIFFFFCAWASRDGVPFFSTTPSSQQRFSKSLPVRLTASRRRRLWILICRP